MNKRTDVSHMPDLSGYVGWRIAAAKRAGKDRRPFDGVGMIAIRDALPVRA
jgi:hypothetical protein